MVDNKTISVYDAEVESYVEIVSQEPAEDDALIRFISRLSRDDLVLDLGCGPAQASAVMQSHGLQVDAVDASIEMVKMANKTYNIGARQALFEDINEVDVYHGVWANFSLLHTTIEDFPQILSALKIALKPKGVFHIGMKIGHGSVRDKLGRLYCYYSKDALCGYLGEAGFKIDDIVFGEALGMAGTIDPWITILSTAE